MHAFIDALDPARYAQHPLHAGDRRWPQTNCWTDLWIEIVHSLRLEPRAMLGFTLAQDYEGDQATFFKVPPEDLERLYGLRLQELSIFDRFETHVVEQVRRKRIVVAEVDGYYLPDTLGVSYGLTHPKTTIGITRIDPERRRLEYFHNDGYFSLDGTDYIGLFGWPDTQRDPRLLFPYTEFVKLPEQPRLVDPVGQALALLGHHYGRRPAANPLRAWAEDFPRHARDLAGRNPDYFHTYAFNLPRQFGANFELLGAHLHWLAERGHAEYEPIAVSADDIAATAKVLQFKLARAMARSRFEGLEHLIEAMALLYDQIMQRLGSILAIDLTEEVAA